MNPKEELVKRELEKHHRQDENYRTFQKFCKFLGAVIVIYLMVSFVTTVLF